MRYTIKSDFHNSEMAVSIKDRYARTDGLDALSALDYEIHDRGDDIQYARRKLARIKNTLCGARDCQCCFTIKE